MRPFSAGASYLSFTHEADRVRDAYGDEKYARLVAQMRSFWRMPRAVLPGGAVSLSGWQPGLGPLCAVGMPLLAGAGFRGYSLRARLPCQWGWCCPWCARSSAEPRSVRW
jgi:hypothetical protein